MRTSSGSGPGFSRKGGLVSFFYQWQRQLLDHAARALEPQRGAATREKKLEDQVDALQQRLRRKDSVIAEISEEFVKVKKDLGEL